MLRPYVALSRPTIERLALHVIASALAPGFSYEYCRGLARRALLAHDVNAARMYAAAARRLLSEARASNYGAW